MVKQAGNPGRYDDEIDLRELFANLWAERLLIVLVTLVIGGAAAAYAFLSTPVYEAKSSLLPPRLSDIVGYNLGRGATKPGQAGAGAAQSDLATFTVKDVYDVFTRNLLSEAAKRDFFRDVYLPSLPEDKRALPQDELLERFNKLLSAKAPDVKNRPEYFEVRVELDDPALAAEWVNQFVMRAAERSLRDMQRNVRSEVSTRIQTIEQQIEVLRNAALKRRQDRIAQLSEALRVAEAVGQEQPLITTLSATSSGELGSFDGSLMYMRGAKAIRAELQVLETRQSDDPFILELRDLQDRLELLQRIDVKPDNVAVFTLDSVAEVPETPIKPKKTLILAIGLVLGGMLGVLIALIRSMLRKGRLAKA